MNVDIYRIFTFVNNDYLTNGIFTVPSSGLYNIKIVIYKVENQICEPRLFFYVKLSIAYRLIYGRII